MKTVEVLNSNDPETRLERLLELQPNAQDKGKIYNPGLPLYQCLEEQLTGTTNDQLIEVLQLLEDRIWRRNVMLLAIDNSITDKHIDEANDLIDTMDSEYRYEGYRKLLAFYAQDGDVKSYKATLKKCDKRKNKQELQRIENELVCAVSTKEGFEAALKLVPEGNYWLTYLAIKARFAKDTKNTILDLIDTYLESEQVRLIEAKIDFLKYQSENSILDLELTKSLMENIKAIDPKLRVAGTQHTLRQLSLWRLGSVLIEAQEIDECRNVIKAMGNSSSKKELIQRLNKKSCNKSRLWMLRTTA